MLFHTFVRQPHIHCMKASDRTRKTLNAIFRVVLFFVASAILVYLFPREGKFRYEYEKGKPWMHDLLIAPFDFPVLKATQELKADQDSVLIGFQPYYSIDTTMVIAQVRKLKDDFSRKWQSLDEKIVTFPSDSVRTMTRELFLSAITASLDSEYAKGIISDDEGLNKPGAPSQVEILFHNHASQVRAVDVLTPRKAYEKLVKAISDSLTGVEKYTRDEVHGILANLDLNDYLYPNLRLEKYKSAQARKALLTQVSITRGMVHEGEKIIFKGELVNDSTYRVIESLRKEYEKRLGTSSGLVVVGQSMLVMSAMVVVFLFLISFRREVFQNRIRILFIILLIVLIAFIARLIMINGVFSVYVIPIAIVPILIRTFYDSRLAVFMHMIMVLIIGFWVPNGFEYVFISFIAGLVAIFMLSNVYRRGRLFLSSVMVVVAYAIVYTGMSLIQEGSFSQVDWHNLYWFGANGLLLLSSYPLIYIFEKTFNFLSDATLIELSDTNQPLLRKLAEVAPGTFQHSLQVANLSEQALHKIGGNSLLIRAGALYHDIGKLENPMYFIENQAPGVNYHDKLAFEESAGIIIGHTQRGVEVARKNGLPEQIIEFIVSHHGTTAVQYFYKSYLRQNPAGEMDVEKFYYPGPKPVTREAAVLMMADSVEAASRSLREVNEKTLSAIVETIISNQVAEGQFNEANITFRDISLIKEVFKRKLLNIYHIRIEYPK